MRATKTLHVDATPEQVTSFLVDQSVIPSGMTMEAIYESPAIVGNSYEWTFKVLGIPRKGVTVTTEYVPGERVAFWDFGTIEGTGTWTVEPDDGGSKATVAVDTRLLPIPIIDRFFDPILRRMWEKNLAWGLRELEKRSKDEKATAKLHLT